MKIYISGKISGLPYEEAFANFERGETLALQFFTKYCADGHRVVCVNPMKEVQGSELTYDESMRLDIILLCGCAGIFMLNNWKDSKGAQLEHDIAQRLHLAIAYEND